MIPSTRRAGVLLHPTSLPCGTLADAPRWLEFLHACGFCVWQMLPLGIPLVGRSPYQSVSAFAVDPSLFPESDIDPAGYADWQARQAYWLDDFARFMVIKTEQGGRPWTEWPAALRDREPGALRHFDVAHGEAMERVRRAQYRAASYWHTLRAQAAARGVALFGDMPIFVAHDSADVWARRDLFLLDAGGYPEVVAGVPPDYFSETGQRWGNPHYDWDAMRADDFAWWRARLAAHFQWFDLVRIDHFRGLVAAWHIPASEPTAVHGAWVPTPGGELLQAIADRMGPLPLVAEDLGIITPDVTALRQRFNLPNMAVLQFAFDAHADNPHKPQNVQFDTVYYTGTHDNDTTVGWWQVLPAALREQVMAQLGVTDVAAVPDVMVDTVLHSRAGLAILPLQDLLGLDSAARMNTPGTVSGNWTWRFDWNALTPELTARLLDKNRKAQRCPTPDAG